MTTKGLEFSEACEDLAVLENGYEVGIDPADIEEAE